MDLDVFKEEWEDWRGNKVTKAFLKVLFDKREFLKEMMAENGYETDKERMIDTGQCIAIKDNIEYAISGFQYLDREKDENAEGSGV